jgi:glycosyltransferase involved in cell wall biosynthesis
MEAATKTILIINPYFYPGYKAGGPVQSLLHLVEHLGQRYRFAVFTSAHDLGETSVYPSVQPNQWQTLTLNGKSVSVWYASGRITQKAMLQCIQMLQPNEVYINGMYGMPWFIWPLQWWKRKKIVVERMIVCPRGMLQPGALAVKPWRKKIYFKGLGLLALCKGVVWHATTPDEADDIRRFAGQNARVVVAANIPKWPLQEWLPSNKLPGRLQLIYLSLITEKKNLLLLLQALRLCAKNITLDIYGPVVDTRYWQECEKQMQQMPAHIQVAYKGSVQSHAVQSTIAQYDALVLLTKGENFGHAIYESLSAARPVLISTFTPWQQLQEQQAGWDIPIDAVQPIAHTIDELALMETSEWTAFCAGAHTLALQTVEQNNWEQDYGLLFD